MSANLVERSWSRIEEWLRAHAPSTLATLNPPVDPVDLAAAEEALGAPLPEDLVASLRIHDGVDARPVGRLTLPRGFHPLPLRRCLERKRGLDEVLAEFDEEMAGHWWDPQWLPVAEHIAGDALIVDLRASGDRGRAGEFLNEGSARFGRWPSFAALLAETADLLEGLRTDELVVPRVASGRLVWGQVESHLADPRSLLALADAAAAEPAETEPAEPPAHAGPKVRLGPGRYAVATARRVDRRRAAPAPPPADPAEWILELGQCCLTFAQNLTAAELAARFGGDPGKLTPLTGEQAVARESSWRGGYRPLLRTGEVNGWAFGFEQRHEYGAAAETLRRLSSGTRAVSVVCNSTITQFCYAEDGVVLAFFDNRWPGRLEGAAPGRFRPLLEEAGLLPADPERYVEDEALSALALAIRLGPGEFDPAVLAAPLPAAALLPLLADPPTEAWPMSVRVDPEVVAAIEHATEEQLRPVVVALARGRATEIGLNTYPEIVAALAEATQGPRGIDDDSPLGRALRTLHAEAHAVNAVWADHADRSARKLLTEPERSAWQQRSSFARTLAELLTRPAAVAAYSLVGPPEIFGERTEFLAGLAEVAVPDDAVSRLVQTEQERLHTNQVPMSVHRKSRRQSSLGVAYRAIRKA